RWYRWIFGNTILRRSSQWYVLFTGFMFPKNQKPRIFVDVLTKDNHLYKGEIADYFLDGSGNPSELLLKGFSRFRRSEFERVREKGEKPNSNDYWTAIPGANLVVPYSNIANINIRYEFTEQALVKKARAILGELKISAGGVTFTAS